MIFRRRKKADSPVVHAGDHDFEAAVSDAEVAVVDFWGPGCGPCRAVSPILDEVAVEHEHQGVRVIKVNVEEAPETAHAFEIRSVPTVIFFRRGEPLFQFVGLVSKPVIERELEELVGGG